MSRIITKIGLFFFLTFCLIKKLQKIKAKIKLPDLVFWTFMLHLRFDVKNHSLPLRPSHFCLASACLSMS
jgi:hypothetical protein